ncbi:MAG: hypothetical protein KZQ83_18750 [gamma proteobacterium symbiont of Taylorina sp.]|nr:hypothetical protein [gamma proteobacterium symbiont of Taylorina sp.]
MIKKIIIALFILGISSIALLKGSLWYLTQQFVDHQIFNAKPFVQISYKEIDTSMKGSAIVNGVRIFIPALNETIFVKSIEFITPDLLTFLLLDSQLQKKQIPESLSLIISDAAIDLNGPVMDMIDNPDIEPSVMEAFSTLACGDTNRMGSRTLSKMGYETINNNIKLNYQFYPQKKLLTYTISNHVEDMSRITFNGDIYGLTDLKAISVSTLKPAKITLEIEDDSYIKRKNDFCALQEKYSVKEYITEHSRQVGEYLGVYGIGVEEGLLNAYMQLLKTSGILRFEADLSQFYETISGADELKTFAPNDIIQFIRLKLFVNSKRIDAISIKVDTDKLIAAINNNNSSLEKPGDIKKKQVLVYKKYHTVSSSGLKKYHGYRVKIETYSGKHYKGNLSTDNPKYFEVITRMKSGNIGYQVSKGSIKKAEVYY